MESAITSLPQQQQGDMANSQGAAAAGGSSSSFSSSSSSSSSGSIGPFFAVISVLTVLAIASCVMGRICFRRRLTLVPVTPLDTIKHGGCLGWFKRKCRRCMAGEVEVGAKVMSCGEGNKNTSDGHPPQV